MDAIAQPAEHDHEHDDHVPDARVVRTFAFIDLSGFTALTDTEGDAEAVHVLARFRQAVRQISSDRAVRVAKWLGDGAMLVSVDREPLVEAIVEIEHAIGEDVCDLPLRAGVASGPVILFEGDDYIGSAVNLAARLCDLAEPGTVIAPSSIADDGFANIRAEPLGALEVRGFEEPMAIVRLDWLRERQSP